MAETEEEEEEQRRALHFTLQLDKPLPCLVEVASWNPEKDLLAMVSTDHQLTVHRFNWQRLWSIAPEKRVTSLCWRPDGKALAAGHEDGKISLHDVENGEVLRTIETHKASISCLYWVEEKIHHSEDLYLSFDDRTPRFFPPPPKAPRLAGTGSAFDMVGALCSGEEEETAHQNAASKSLQKHLSILCSGDASGLVCLNAFGVFPIVRLDMQTLAGGGLHQQLYPVKVALSSNLSNLSVVCYGPSTSLSAVSVDTTLVHKRHKEIRQVSLQASNVEELLDVLQASLAVMRKSWLDAIDVFFDKFKAFHMLLSEHGSAASPRDELLSLLACGSASASLHQFLAATLAETGIRRLSKSIEAAGKELQNIIGEHLQPATEIIAFRLGELLGLSRWKSRLQPIGLDHALVESAAENAGMLLVQVERFLHVVADAIGQFRLFFVWLTKALRQLNGEALMPVEQGSPIDSSLLATFLNTQFESDPVGPHLSPDAAAAHTASEEELSQAEDLAVLGGFSDTKFLQRTLFQQYEQLHISCQRAFSMPVSVISPRLFVKRQLLLSDLPSPQPSLPALALTYYEIKSCNRTELIDYTCVQRSDGLNYVGIFRGFSCKEEAEVVVLQLERGLGCVDLALYKERQLVLLLTETQLQVENAQAWITVLPLEDMPFIMLDGMADDFVQACTTQGAVVSITLKDGKTRGVPQRNVVPPLAVSASRGLACVFAAQRRALLYDLEEDEEDKDDDASI